MRVSIDISSDHIAIYHGMSEKLLLERSGVDRELGKVLVNLDREQAISECLVLNGPGGFTNLRVGTLALNLLKTLKNNQISFFSLSKLELYNLFYQKGWIESKILVYIGQRLNVWLWDLESGRLISTVKKSEIDQLSSQYPDLTLDQVYDTTYFEPTIPQLSYEFRIDGCYLKSGNIEHFLSRDELTIHPVERLEPNYMIEPNVS
ncbi:hypothetical protein D8B45_01975 [Candidatus Gracilibacteria bacterium]|nr:MAG: hypothetical protein D8B45_01975 [Candidatus Gracilibacteria bacterium]